MRKIAVIALNTFREAIRDKVLYIILAFALAMIGSSLILITMSVGGESKIIRDMGLASLSGFGMIIAIFVGVSLVYKEVEKRTIYTIISKPLHRYQFIVGKYLGLVLTLLVTQAIMAAGFLLLLFSGEGRWSFPLLWAVLLIFVELMVITGIAIFFSSFSTPILSIVFTFSLFVVGHLLPDLKLFARRFAGPLLKAVINGIYYLLPNLTNFDIKGQVVHGVPVSMSDIGLSLLYGFLYATLLLTASAMIFARRDFK